MGRIPAAEIYRILSTTNGVVGLYVEDCETGEKLVINPDEVFPAASVIKIPMVALLLRDGAEGRVDLHKPVKIAPENRVGGTGVLCDLNPSFEPTLFEMAKLMINLSDNVATNQVMDVIGVDRFHAFCSEMGCSHFVWQRKMMDFVSLAQGKNNFLCPGHTGEVVTKIAKGEFVSKEISDTLYDFMCGQKYRTKLPTRIPAVDSNSSSDPIGEDEVMVGNKTGDLGRVQHDVGIFELPDHHRYTISMFTKDMASDQEGMALIAEVSKAVYLAMK